MNGIKWNIEYYYLQSGQSPVATFINELTPKTKAKLIKTFELMREFGIRVGPPHVKKIIGSPLWEIRVLGQDSVRIIYFISKDKTFLLVHGFIKKKQKTPLKEIETALRRLKKY